MAGLTHRIRAAGLITRGDSILLVRHEQDGRDWWVPPGGGLEGDETLVDCVRREVAEETNLASTVGVLVYIRQFVERRTNTHHLELFFHVPEVSGELAAQVVDGADPHQHEILEARYVSRTELQSITVVPVELCGLVWDDLAAGFPLTRFFGVELEEAR